MSNLQDDIDLFCGLIDSNEDELLNFLIVSCISADTLVDANACKKSIELIDCLEQAIVKSHIEQEKKNQLKNQTEKAKTIISRDLKIFENGK